MDFLVFLYLIIFPFGKLIPFVPDILIFLIIVVFGFKNRFNFKINNFLVVCIFSLVFSLIFFRVNELTTGVLYLGRFIIYFLLSQIIYELYGKKKIKRELIFNALMLIGISIALFGFIQYFLMPDMRALKVLGWDDHYFRLVSTFLDPAFTGILLVLTEIMTIVRKRYFLSVFVLIAILLTYSRASFLALAVVLIFLIFKLKDKFIIFLLTLFLVGILFLPQSGGEGTNLERTYSVNQKFISYEKSVLLISKSPIFGIGFNNVCIAKSKILNENSFNSHACSGLDNSLLFIIATTGIIGFITFIDFIVNIISKTKLDYIGITLLASLIAVLIHGMFTETFFYNFILGWLALLIGISRIEGDF